MSDSRLAETMVWRPVETADTSKLFASSTWVLVHTSEGRVTEATPYYSDGGRYIWMTARGANCRGSDNEFSEAYMHDSVTHWMPLPEPPHD